MGFGEALTHNMLSGARLCYLGIIFKLWGCCHKLWLSFFTVTTPWNGKKWKVQCINPVMHTSIQMVNVLTNLHSHAVLSDTLLFSRGLDMCGTFLTTLWKVTYEPAHDKIYNKTCVTSKASDQSVHPPSIARIFVYLSLDSPEAAEGTYDQWRLWLDYADAQADLSLHWSHMSYCRFCGALAQIFCNFLFAFLQTRSILKRSLL